MPDFDVIVIGAGAAGEVLAGRTAAAGQCGQGGDVASQRDDVVTAASRGLRERQPDSARVIVRRGRTLSQRSRSTSLELRSCSSSRRACGAHASTHARRVARTRVGGSLSARHHGNGSADWLVSKQALVQLLHGG